MKILNKILFSIVAIIIMPFAVTISFILVYKAIFGGAADHSHIIKSAPSFWLILIYPAIWCIWHEENGILKKTGIWLKSVGAGLAVAFVIQIFSFVMLFQFKVVNSAVLIIGGSYLLLGLIASHVVVKRHLWSPY